MGKTIYKPLTPSLRADIIACCKKNIVELRKCQNSVFVLMYIRGYEEGIKLINALPDGYPIPFTKD